MAKKSTRDPNYWRERRKNKPEVRIAEMARQRALREVANNHPEEFQYLLDWHITDITESMKPKRAR